MTKRRDQGARRQAKSWDRGERNPKSEGSPKSEIRKVCRPLVPFPKSSATAQRRVGEICEAIPQPEPKSGQHFLVRSVLSRLVDKRDQTQRCKVRRGTQRRLPSTTSATFAVLAPNFIVFGEDFREGQETAEARRTQRRRFFRQSLRISRLCGLLGSGFWLRLCRPMPRRLVRLSADRVSTIQIAFRISDFRLAHPPSLLRSLPLA